MVLDVAGLAEYLSALPNPASIVNIVAVSALIVVIEGFEP